MSKAGEHPVTARERIPIVEAVMLAGFFVLPLLVEDYHTVYATRILILAFLALSFDLVWGFAGVMSFGQAVFFGGAGFLTAVVARDYDTTSLFVLLPLGFLTGGGLALILGIFLLQGGASGRMIFVALGTLICSYAVERLARGWELLGGQNGIFSFPSFSWFGTDLYEGTAYFYLCLSLFVAAYLLVRIITRSQLGLVLSAIRENEARVQHFGYNVGALKIAAFVLAGAIAGLGGVLMTFHDAFISPSSVGVVLSTQAVIYVLLGGSGTRIGAVLGVVLIEGLSFWLTDNYREIWPIILALVLLAIVMIRPAGLVSLFVSEAERAGSFGARLRGPK